MKRTILPFLVLALIVLVPPAMAQSPQRGLAVAPTQVNAGSWGTYYALIIGINDYAKWPRLQTAVKDATVIRDTLITNYGFNPQNVILRTDRDANRIRITGDLRYLAVSMSQNDNLLVYFAGHGQLADFTGDGYWVPAEGALKDPATWVANSYIKAVLSSEKLQAKNVVVIADSCYSGSMLRGGPSLMSLEDRRYKEKLAQKAALRSRQVISSGGVEPVADGGADGHSLFAYYLINALKTNDREVIDLENLFHTRVWEKVTQIGDQRPNVGRLKTPMDQDGQFVLYNAAWAEKQARKQAAAQATAQAAAKKEEQARQKAAVASAELELQRQRIQMEKQKLALERDKLAQQKSLEMERLKLEREKQEIAYAKMQARLDKLENDRKLADQRTQLTKQQTQLSQQQTQLAAVDKSLQSERPVFRERYKLALFPINVIESATGGLANFEAAAIQGVYLATGKSDAVEFAASYKITSDLPETITPLAEKIDKKELAVWKKKSFLSKPEPDLEQIRKVCRKLDMDIAALIKIHADSDGVTVTILVYNARTGKMYNEKIRARAWFGVGNLVDEYTTKLLEKYKRSL